MNRSMELARGAVGRAGLEAALLSRASHDLKSPLFSILTAAELLSDADPEDSRRLVWILKRNGERLRGLIDDLLVFAEQGFDPAAARPEPLDLDAELQELARPRAELFVAAGVDFELNVAPRLPRAWADPALVRAAAARLLDEALRSTRAGGRVCVSAFVNQGELEFQIARSGAADAQDASAGFERAKRGLGSLQGALEAQGGGFFERAGDGWQVFAVRLPAWRS